MIICTVLIFDTYMTIAIDFGTSNTLVTRWNPVSQQPETLTLSGLSLKMSDNPPLIPSLVYVEDASRNEVIIGQNVRDRGLDLKSDSRFFRSFKRGIGADIQGFLPELDEEVITFEKVGELFLSSVINNLIETEFLGKDVLESLILTVPVDSFETYRNWLGHVCQSLPVQQIRMIDEPTASALGYGIKSGGTILVVDFGGGTLDLSLVRLETKNIQQPLGFILKWGQKDLSKSNQKSTTARVLAKAGQNLGGSDIDNWIGDYFTTTQGVKSSPLITRLAEKLKIQLSSKNQASEVYFDDQEFESYQLDLDRDTLETILKQNDFFTRLDESMIQVLQQARRVGIETTDIDAVLLVGGTVLIPSVKTWINQYFDRSKIKSEKPFEAIAQGALQLTQGVEVQDFLYHNYGIRYWDRRNNKHNWHSIIKSGQSYPLQKPIELLLGASVENQPSIELIIGELGTDTGNTEVYFDGDRLITKLLSSEETLVKPLNDRDGARTIAQLNPPGFPGSDRIKLLFTVDEKCFLRLTVKDLLTNQTLLENQIVVQLS